MKILNHQISISVQMRVYSEIPYASLKVINERSKKKS